MLEHTDPELIKKLVQDGMPKSSVLTQLESVLLGNPDKNDSSILNEYRMVELGRGPEAWVAGGTYSTIEADPLEEHDFSKLVTRLKNLSVPLKSDQKTEDTGWKKAKSKSIDLFPEEIGQHF